MRQYSRTTNKNYRGLFHKTQPNEDKEFVKEANILTNFRSNKKSDKYAAGAWNIWSESIGDGAPARHGERPSCVTSRVAAFGSTWQNSLTQL